MRTRTTTRECTRTVYDRLKNTFRTRPGPACCLSRIIIGARCYIENNNDIGRKNCAQRKPFRFKNA